MIVNDLEFKSGNREGYSTKHTAEKVQAGTPTSCVGKKKKKVKIPSHWKTSLSGPVLSYLFSSIHTESIFWSQQEKPMQMLIPWRKKSNNVNFFNIKLQSRKHLWMMNSFSNNVSLYFLFFIPFIIKQTYFQQLSIKFYHSFQNWKIGGVFSSTIIKICI